MPKITYLSSKLYNNNNNNQALSTKWGQLYGCFTCQANYMSKLTKEGNIFSVNRISVIQYDIKRNLIYVYIYIYNC